MKTKTRIRLVEALMLFVCFAFFGCGDGGGGGTGGSDRTTGTNNLTASGLSVVSAEPRVGYPLEVNTLIEAKEFTENVSVSYYALNKSDVDQELDEVRQFFLATVTFPTVEPSVTEYLAEFPVPPEVDPPGEYVLQYIVDPGNTVAETDDDLDENDNSNSGDVLLAPIGNPNLFIEELTLDSPVLLLYNHPDNNPAQDGQMVQDVHDSDAGATLVVGLEGALEPLDATVFVYLRITRDALPLGQNTHDVPMYLWDSVAQRYVDAYGTPPDMNGPPEGLSIGTLSPQMVAEVEGSESELYLPPDAGVEMVTGAEDTDDLHTSDRTSAHLDIYYPGGLAKEMKRILETLPSRPCPPGFVCTLAFEPPIVAPPDLTEAAIAALRSFFRGATKQSVREKKTRFSIVASVVCGASGCREDSLVDNEASVDVDVDLDLLGEEPFVRPAPAEPIKGVGEGTEAGFHGENFGVRFKFDSGASLDNRGAIAFVGGSVPVRIFKSPEFDFMRLDARAQVVPADDPQPPEGETSEFDLVLVGVNPLSLVNPLSNPTYVSLYTKHLDLGHTYPGEEDDDCGDEDCEPADPPPCPDNDTDLDEILNPVLDDDGNEISSGDDECPDEPGFIGNKGCPYSDPADPDYLPNPVPTGCPATQEFSVSKAVIYNQLFFVGPVPFTASASVGGTIGFELYANIQPFGLAAKAAPFAKLEATITGAVGIPALKAGFGGTLTFIDERFHANVTTALTFSYPEGGGLPIGFEGHFSMSVINTLTGPEGELFLFTDYPKVKWCTKRVLGRLLTYPCGKRNIRNKLVLAKFEPFVKEDVLFDVALCKARTFGILGETRGWSACP